MAKEERETKDYHTLKKEHIDLQTQLENYAARVKDLELTITKLETLTKIQIEKEKKAFIKDFTIELSHIINNPLNFIQHSVGLMSDLVQFDQEEDKVYYAQLAAAYQEGVNRIENVVRTLSAMDSLKQHFVDLNIFTERTIKDLEQEFKIPARIKRDYAEEQLLTTANKHGLTLILKAIIKNAIESTSKLDEITVQTRKQGNQLYITVEDRGVGVDAENINKVFSPFFTTKFSVNNEGSGLFQAQAMVDQHGGEIYFESEKGKGTKVTVVLVSSSVRQE